MKATVIVRWRMIRMCKICDKIYYFNMFNFIFIFFKTVISTILFIWHILHQRIIITIAIILSYSIQLHSSIQYPAQNPNAPEVFYRVITNSGNGPPVFVDDLLETLKVPLLLLWGEKDPWIRPKVMMILSVTHTYIHIHLSIHVHIYTHIHRSIHPSAYIHIYILTYKCIHTKTNC